MKPQKIMPRFKLPRVRSKKKKQKQTSSKIAKPTKTKKSVLSELIQITREVSGQIAKSPR